MNEFDVRKVKDREEFIIFIDKLAQSYKDDPQSWKNKNLDQYLNALLTHLSGEQNQNNQSLNWNFLASCLLGS